MIKIITPLLIAFSCAASVTEVTKPTKLFNGKNFDGWYVAARGMGVLEEQDYFTVKDGMIHAYASHEHLSEQPYAGLITKANYSRYHLTLEYKWGEKKFKPRHDFVRDAGIMYHVFGDDIIWPNCLECQIQEGDTGDAWIIGSKATSKVSKVIRNYAPDGEPVTRGGTDPRFDRFHRGYCWEVPGWNKVEVIVDGDHSIFKVNGRVVNELFDSKRPDPETGEWIPLTEGKILLQAEGAEIFYRNVIIKPLED